MHGPDRQAHQPENRQAPLAVRLASALTISDLLLLADTIKFQLQWTREGIGPGPGNRCLMTELLVRIDAIVVAATAAGDIAEPIERKPMGIEKMGIEKTERLKVSKERNARDFTEQTGS